MPAVEREISMQITTTAPQKGILHGVGPSLSVQWVSMPAVDQKKVKEFERLLAFQNACHDCPRSTLIQPEPPSPDGLFPESRLGIEITEYSLGQGKGGSLPRQQETVHQRITQEAQFLYEAKISRHLQVSVLWTVFTACPTVKEENQIAQKIAWHVFENTSIQLQPCSVLWKDVNDPLLTKYGLEINIYPIAGVGKSCWSSMACFGFPPEATRIQNVLDEKESRVADYRKTCDKVWLLIVASSDFFSSQFTPDSRLGQMKFKSSFGRIFLLEEPQNTIHEFQIDR
jgi:hypothetical protein